MPSSGQLPTWGGQRFQSRFVDSRVIEVQADVSAAITPIRRIGGKRGWYYGNWLWSLRGFLDLLACGVGTRRGRRDPETPHVEDTLDFWRVEAYEPDHLLRLRAEMKLPGRAWLEFEVKRVETADPSQPRSSIRQTAMFDPVGLSGLSYWYSLYIVYQFVCSGMLRRIGEEAEKIQKLRHPTSAKQVTSS